MEAGLNFKVVKGKAAVFSVFESFLKKHQQKEFWELDGK